jgi:carboxylesterase
MPGHSDVDPRPFVLEGGRVGCLLIHGFTGAPAEMRLLGEYLHGCGLTVSAPLLAGHGTEPEDLNRVSWHDWEASAEGALSALRARCDTLFVGGLSLGSLVAIHLAARYDHFAGIMLYSPGLKAANKLLYLAPILRHLVRQWPGDPDEKTDLLDPEAPGRLWHYQTVPTTGADEMLKMQRATRRLLPQVRTPAIIFYSTHDATLDPRAPRIALDGLGSPDKELVILHNSGHCMTVDREREAIFARTYGFIVAHGGA